MTEFVKDGTNGFVFLRGNVDDLERVLRRVVQDPELIEKMSKTTEYNRTTREMTEEVFSIYKSIVKIDA